MEKWALRLSKWFNFGAKSINIALEIGLKISKNIVFGLLIGKSMFPLFLRLPDRKILDPNGS